MNYGKLVYLEITENLKNLSFYSFWGNILVILKIVLRSVFAAGVAASYQQEHRILCERHTFIFLIQCCHHYIVLFFLKSSRHDITQF